MDAIKRNRRALALALAAAGALSAQTAMAARPRKFPLPQPAAGHPCGQTSGRCTVGPPMSRCRANAMPAAGLSAFAPGNVGLRGACSPPAPSSSRCRRHVRPPGRIRHRANSPPTSPADIAAVKQVIEATRKGKEADADAAAKSHHRSGRAQARRMGDPAQRQHQSELPALRRLRERQSELAARAAVPPPRRERAVERRRRATPRCAPFSPTISRAPPRAATCWRARCSPRATAPAPRRWCATPGATTSAAPTSRAKCSRCSASMLTRADHKARMEQRFYADDVEAGMRAAERLGGNDLAIATRPRGGDQASRTMPRRCSTRCRRPRAATPAIFSRACNGCAKTTSRKKPAS